MTMKLRVRSLSGSVEVEAVPPSCSVQGLVLAASQAAARQGLSDLLVPPVDKARLLHKGKPLSLQGGETLLDAGVVDGDTLVILERRPEPEPEAEDLTPSPDMETVNRLTMREAKARGNQTQSTAHWTRQPPAVSGDGSLRSLEANLQHLLSAVETLNSNIPGTSLQGLGGGQGIGDAIDGMDNDDDDEEEEEELPLPEPDLGMVEQLKEMGFLEDTVKKALLLCHNRLEQAMEWLLEHAGDADASTPLTEAELRGLAVAAAGRRRPARRQRMNASLIRQMLAGQPGNPSTPAYSAPPPPELVAQLEEMGFTSAQASRALRAFGNNVEMACNWLLASGFPSDGGIEPPFAAQPSASELLAAEPAAEEGLPAPMAESDEVRTPYGNPNSVGSVTTLSTLANEDAEGAAGSDEDVNPEVRSRQSVWAAQPGPSQAFSCELHTTAERAVTSQSTALVRGLPPAPGALRLAAALLNASSESGLLSVRHLLLGALQALLTSQGVEYSAFRQLLQNPPPSLGNERLLEVIQAMIDDPTSLERFMSDPDIRQHLMSVHQLFSRPSGQ